jgi:hypothetical protein
MPLTWKKWSSYGATFIACDGYYGDMKNLNSNMAFLTSLALFNSKVKRCIHTCIALCTCNQPLADAALCKQKSWLLFVLWPHRFYQHSTVLCQVPPTFYCTWNYTACVYENTDIVDNRVEIALKIGVAHSSEILVTSYFYQIFYVEG